MPPNLRDILVQGLREHQSGNLAEARRLYEQVLRHNPNDANALHLLGVLLQQTGEPQRAIELLTRAVELSPAIVEFRNDLARVLQSEGTLRLNQRDLPGALSLLTRCVALNPDNAAARENLAIALLLDQQFSAAVRHFEAVIASGGAVASTYYHFGLALLNQGDLERALGLLQRAAESDPKHLPTREMLAHCLLSMRRGGEGIAVLREAVKVAPTEPSIRATLANLLLAEHRIDDAVEQCEIAIALAPENPFAHLALARALLEMGLQDRAIEHYRRGLSLQPDLNPAQAGYLFALHHSSTWTAEQILEEIRNWAAKWASPLYRVNRGFENERAPDRPLRVGFISGEFANSPVGRFLAHLIEQIDAAEVQIVCFSDVFKADEMTARFERAACEWHSITALNDDEVAQTIQTNRIDILVDLALFTSQRRLLVFARRPAPIQLTYLCYAGTSGLATMDYRISDPHIDPPGTEDLYSEQTLRVQSYWCYEPPPNMPEVSPLPATSNGFVTFGSFNRFAKVTPQILRDWLEILERVPNSRLLLHCDSDARYKQVQDEFSARVDPARVEQVRHTSSDFFKLYHRIDIALDPHPFGGGTTTCDALYMGVPVVTLAGRNGVARGGVSLLSHVGLAELIAQSPRRYIEIATDLASDTARLASLRSTLRQRMQRSPLMDAGAFVRHFETAMRSIWLKWCQSR